MNQPDAELSLLKHSARAIDLIFQAIEKVTRATEQPPQMQPVLNRKEIGEYIKKAGV